MTQNSILVHPTTPVESTNQNQRQITVQRIGRDARPLLPCEIARYQHMFTNQRIDNPRRTEVQNFVPETRERTENSRLRTLAQRIPRLNAVSTSNPDFRVIPWSERSRLDQDYVLRLPVLDVSRMGNRIMNPALTHTVNPESLVNNPRQQADSSEADYN